MPEGEGAKILEPVAFPSNGETMSDKSPKSKKRDQKQRKLAKAAVAAAAKSKQDNQGQAPKVTPKQGKK